MGRERHLDWYHNLVANPDITYELGAGKVDARAKSLVGDARDTAWNDIVAAMPFFGEYQHKVSRKIPVFEHAPR